MMRSLWSGVSGLQAHQVAMDVEGNNIANVNTVGYKYSRTNFADMLSQTSKIATAPTGELGGRNSTQVGLGSAVNSITHVFSQGSRQSTDVKTDVALEGDGFFIVSADAGITKKYTRAGDFDIDANGNLVNTAGLVVQGWVKDTNNVIDPTKPSGNIQIDPGLTVPARSTEKVQLRANLTSGPTAGTYSAAYSLDSTNGAGGSIADPTQPNMANVNQKPEDIAALFNDSGKAYNLQTQQGMWVSFVKTQYTQTIGAATAGDQLNIILNTVPITAILSATTTAGRASELANIINAYTPQTGVRVETSGSDVIFINSNQTEGDSKKNILLGIGTGAAAPTPAAPPVSAIPAGTADASGLANIDQGVAGAGAGDTSSTTAYKYQYTNATVAGVTPYDVPASASATKTFHTTEDLRQLMQEQAQVHSAGALVNVDTNGRFVVTNPTGSALYIGVTSIDGDTAGTGVQSIPKNTLFTTTFDAMEGTLNTGTGSSKASTAMNAAIHGASVDIYDSLGAKHTISYTFRKESTNTWSWTATVPEPGQIAGVHANDNEKNVYKYGKVSFNTDGSLQSVDPVSISVSWNNGSTANQEIAMDFGKTSTFEGLTNTARASSTALIAQDGYASGSLDDIAIDQNGVLVGTFTNGQNIGLAQIAVANFANNEGLMADGANLFMASANSGDPTIGAAASGSRGAIFSNALEMSNVDLSKALTDLIVIQRGYQANSKTITTSDQMLQVLLQIKN